MPRTAPGTTSRYWRGDDWWGVGPGAHSHVGGVRWWNVKHPAAYAERLAAGVSPAAGREMLDAATRALERVLLRTRIREGIADRRRCTRDGRHAVAGLIADGLVDAQAALAGRADAHQARAAARRRRRAAPARGLSPISSRT